jgi:hypothetical protein
LPTLMCRELGPFANASLQSLRMVQLPVASANKLSTQQPSTQQQKQQFLEEIDSRVHHERLEIHGPILPCAMQSILAIVVGSVQKEVLPQGYSDTRANATDTATSPGNAHSPDSQSILSLSDTSFSEASRTSAMSDLPRCHVSMQASVHTGDDNDSNVDGILSSRATKSRKKTVNGACSSQRVGCAGSQTMYLTDDQGFLSIAAWDGKRPDLLAIKLDRPGAEQT